MILKILKIFFFVIILSNNLLANTQFFQEGLNLYKNKKYEEAKFKFEQDIVFNPKSEKAYLYLSKIYNEQDNKEFEEKNLNTVILLNPKNERVKKTATYFDSHGFFGIYYNYMFERSKLYSLN